MKASSPAQEVEWIAIDQIAVVNPRAREKRAFREIVESVEQVGLKRPITVARRRGQDGEHYELVCGQGRLEAYRELGQATVPALIVTADSEDCLIASLVENCARRQHNVVDLLHDIGRLGRVGYSHADIARKTGLSFEYVSGVSHLLEHGEQLLLRAVESRQMPLSVAIQIADVEDHVLQRTLQDAYDQGLLRGKRLIAAKRLLEVRRRRGKGLGHIRAVSAPKISANALIRAYEDDAARKRDLIRRARSVSDRLLLIVEALCGLLRDPQFVAVLEAENLSTMPEAVARRVGSRVKVAA